MTDPSLLQDLIIALKCLPGVGAKTAQRMAFHLLERDRKGGERLAAGLSEALARIGHCRLCRNFSEHELCPVCESGQRDDTQLFHCAPVHHRQHQCANRGSENDE